MEKIIRPLVFFLFILTPGATKVRSPRVAHDAGASWAELFKYGPRCSTNPHSSISRHFRSFLQPTTRNQTTHFRSFLQPTTTNQTTHFRSFLQPTTRNQTTHFRSFLQPTTRNQTTHFRMAAPRLALTAFMRLLPVVALTEGMRGSRPKTCCSKFHLEPVPKERVASYTRTSQQCSNPAIVLRMVFRLQLCVKPSTCWEMELVSYLDAKPAPGETSNL